MGPGKFCTACIDGLSKFLLFLQGQETVEIVNQNQTVREPEHGIDVSETRQDGRSIYHVAGWVVMDAIHFIDNQADGAAGRVGENQLIVQLELPRRQMKALADVGD